MRTQHLFLIIIFSFLVSFPAIASDWVEVGSSNNLTMYVDKQSIKGDINSRTFWEKSVFKEREKIDYVSGNYYNTTKQYVEVDCKNSIKKLYEITYYSDGEVIGYMSPSKPPIARVIPDSVGEAVKEYVCSFKPTK